jgi:hypothetical protein
VLAARPPVDDDGDVAAPRPRDGERVRTVDYAEILPAHGQGPGGETLQGDAPPPRRGRRVATGALAVTVGAASAGLVLGRERLAERDAREPVSLSAALGVRTSSTSPPGGRVDFFVSLRNAGRQPLRVTALEAGGEGLLLRGRLENARSLPAGQEIRVPLSVLLDCDEAESWADPARWVADVHVRRGDGSQAARRTRACPVDAELLLR